MPKFEVFVSEVWTQTHIVEAPTAADAQELVGSGEYFDDGQPGIDADGPEYSHTLHRTLWPEAEKKEGG